MKAILVILLALTICFAQEAIDTSRSIEDNPPVEYCDTSQVIIHYYTQQTNGGHLLIAYALGYAVATKFKTEYSSVPTIVYYTSDWRQINLNIVYDIQETRWAE